MQQHNGVQGMSSPSTLEAAVKETLISGEYLQPLKATPQTGRLALRVPNHKVASNMERSMLKLGLNQEEDVGIDLGNLNSMQVIAWSHYNQGINYGNSL